MNKNNKPKIRFKGFTDVWEQRKVSEIGNVVTGSTPKTSISDNYGGEFLFVSPADIQGNRYVDETITTLTQKGFDQGRKVRAKASLFVSIGSTIGKVAQTRQETTTNQQINAVEPYDNFDDDFIFTSLENISGSIKAIASNQAVPIVNKTTFGETDIQVPSELTEQQKIGIYFKNLDNIITLHQRKLEKLQNIKKSMLEKIFPKNGNSLPEIRFKGFTAAWEQRKLDEVVDVRSGRDYKHLKEGNIPVYGTGGYMLSVNEALSEDEDAIGIGRKGTIDNPYILRAPFWTVDTLFYAVPRNQYDLEFVFDIFQKINWKAKDESTGVPSLSKSSINDVRAYIPIYVEQKKIGQFFSKLDNLITLHQRKLEKLKIIKKSMLEKMFVK